MNIRVFVRGVVILAAALFVPAVRAAIIAADVVNVDFNTSASVSPYLESASPNYTGQAAGPVTAGTTWNSIVVGPKVPDTGNSTVHNVGPTAAGTLVDSGNAATSLASSLTVELDNIFQYYTSENPLSSANGGDLLNDYAYRPSTQISSTLTIGGVPIGTYDLYLYSENGNYGNGAFAAISTFTLGASSQTADNTNASTGDFTLNRNYVLYSGLTSLTAGGSFTVTLTGGGVLNGFQLVQIDAPEPSSLMLVALTALPLLRRRQAARC